MKQVIWTSSLDLSEEGIARFCRETAGRYGKTEAQLRALSPLDLAASYMFSERRRKLYEVKQLLSAPTKAPILVIADKADFGNRSHNECFVLTGEHLSDIFSCRAGLVTTFFSDGKDIRCEDIDENGTNFYLFREVTNLRNLHALTSAIERGEAFTASQLDQCSKSIAPQIHQLLGWEPVKKSSLETQISAAGARHDAAETKIAGKARAAGEKEPILQ